MPLPQPPSQHNRHLDRLGGLLPRGSSPFCKVAGAFRLPRHLRERLPGAKELRSERGYNADWFRNALKEKGIFGCSPPHAKRENPPKCDKDLYRPHYRIENMFGGIKTEDASQPGTTDGPTQSFPQSSSPRHVAIGSTNEA